MQQYVDDAMPASDHVCYMLLLLLFRKEKTNPNNLSQTDCLLICQQENIIYNEKVSHKCKVASKIELRLFS